MKKQAIIDGLKRVKEYMDYHSIDFKDYEEVQELLEEIINELKIKLGNDD